MSCKPEIGKVSVRNSSGTGHASTCGHQIDVAGPDDHFVSEAIAMANVAVEQVGYG